MNKIIYGLAFSFLLAGLFWLLFLFSPSPTRADLICGDGWHWDDQLQACIQDCDPTFHFDHNECRGTSIWVTEKSGCGGIKFYEQENCANRSGYNWICDDSSGNAECKVYYHTEISVNPNPAELGDDQVSVVVSGTRSCYTPTPTYNLGDGLKDSGDFTKACTLGTPSCDNNSCTWQAGHFEGNTWVPGCIAKKLNLVDSSGSILPFFADFDSKIQLVSPKGNCQSSTSYIVGPAAACNPDTSRAEDNTVPSNLAKDDQLVGPSLDDDSTISGVVAKANMPNQINDELNQSLASPLPQVGVQTGFFTFLLRELLCRSPIVQFIFGTLYRYCPVEVNLAGQYTPHIGRTEYLANQTSTLIKAERPPQITPVPALKSCFLEDLNNTQKNVFTVGNKRLNTINASMASGPGVYSISLPDEVKNDPALKPKDNGVISNLLDTVVNNLSLNKRVVTGDLRLPDINLKQLLFYQANYPENIKPLYNPPRPQP